MIISFSGTDGTGKTSHSIALCKNLEGKGITVRYIHMMSESFDYSILRYLLLLVRKAHLGVITSQGQIRAHNNIVVRTIWPIVSLLDFMITFFARIRPLARNGVLICDRYFYDYLASFHALGIMANGVLALSLRFIPKPDRIFFLDSDIHVAYSRIRGELPLEYLSKQREAYLRIVQMLNPKPKVIDTNRNRTFVSIEIIKDTQTLLDMSAGAAG